LSWEKWWNDIVKKWKQDIDKIKKDLIKKNNQIKRQLKIEKFL